MVAEMTKERSANVAFLIDGAEGSAKEYVEAAQSAGANVIDLVHYVKCGKISFLDKMSSEEKSAAVKWTEDVIAAMK